MPIKTRLWTSSLQRTILTAEHIPHPIIPVADFDNEQQIIDVAYAPSLAPNEPIAAPAPTTVMTTVRSRIANDDARPRPPLVYESVADGECARV